MVTYASASHVTRVGASKLVTGLHLQLDPLGDETSAGHVARIGASEFVAGDDGNHPLHQLYGGQAG